MKQKVCCSCLLMFTLLTGSILLTSCMSSRRAARKITSQDLPSDSIISTLLGDTVCHTLYSPSIVHAYKMRPQESERDTMIADYAVDYHIGELDASCYSILQFFLKDKVNYVLTDEIVKTPFSPNIGFEFIGSGQERVYVLLAFNGNQMKVISSNHSIHKLFKNEHFLHRFAHSLLPDNSYINHLLNKNK